MSGVTGVDKVMANLSKAIQRTKVATLEGLLDAGIQVEGVARSRTPVKTGTLRNSGYTRQTGELSVQVGFTVAYALAVHENVERNYRVGQAKYLESAVADNRDDIIEIIRRRAMM